MKSFLVTTLGCKVNTYESQAMKEILLNNGYVEDYINPSLIIINTCAVTSVAEHKSRQKTSSYAKKFPNAIIVVCGCSTNIHPEDYQKMNFAHIIMSNNNHEDILKLIDEYNKTQKQVFAVDNNKRQRKYQNLRISSFDEQVRAFVKIGDGCNNFCSYCIVPLSRGNLRSRDKNEILCEISRLIENNYKEIVLTGIDSASYGLEFENYRFDDLLEDIMQIKGLQRLRISSIEASQIDDRFISLLKKYPTIAPHLHIPLQSGSDTVLKRMKRKCTCEEFYKKIEKIKKEIPNIALACDVIVGFPQETEEEFLQTYNFIKKCGFAFLHVFPYSIRKGTYAATLPNQINDQTKKERV
ncbi:MAG: tRNA (N(6)-L-threonylcarbamoyladenosine(37)-C(2))-methylthiotransferase MtaB, partial [Bacilli bacterium]